jgi:hypothetical protein
LNRQNCHHAQPQPYQALPPAYAGTSIHTVYDEKNRKSLAEGGFEVGRKAPSLFNLFILGRILVSFCDEPGFPLPPDQRRKSPFREQAGATDRTESTIQALYHGDESTAFEDVMRCDV